MKGIVAVCAVALLVACAYADPSELKGKIVLVTGGTSGIGFQSALQFAQNGARVIIVARDSDPKHYSGDAAVTAIKNDPTVQAAGGDVRFIKADVSKTTDVDKLFKDILANEGKIEIAVNAAGISGPIGKMDETAEFTETEHDPILNNLYSTIYCMAYEEDIMVTQNISGVILNICGLEGVNPDLMTPRNGASKFSIVGLTKSVAVEHVDATKSPYIRVNAVAPGATATPLLFQKAKHLVNPKLQPWDEPYVTEDSDIWKQSVGNFTHSVPMARIGRPEEIANTIVWLCTDDAYQITADVIIVDGGLWAV